MTLDFENLSDFFENTEFSQEVFFGASGSETAVNAIFDNEFFHVEDSYPDITTSKPKLTCKTSDVANFSQGARVVVAGLEYEIVDKRANGTGITEVILQRT